MDQQAELSRRERQIMDIIYAHGQATVNEIHDQLPNPPTHTAVRTLLKILQDKGHLKSRKRGRENVYASRRMRKKAGLSAMERVIQTFYDGSLEKALGAHLAQRGEELSEDDRKRLMNLIKQTRQSGH